MTAKRKHWAQLPEKGKHFWIALIVWIYRHGGHLLFTAVLRLVIVWYWLFAGRARMASQDYLRTLHQQAGTQSAFTHAPGSAQSYAHLLAFGTSIIDKIAGWMGDIAPESLRIYGIEQLDAVRGRGALLVGSHVGNLELLRALKSDVLQPVTALAHTRHAEMFNQFLSEINPKAGLHVMQVTELGADGAIALQNKIDAGEWLVIAGDRVPVQSERTQRVDFLGRSAAFPEGPWILAALLKCPVLLVFCYRVDDHFEVHIETFRERLQLPRGTRIEALQSTIADYAKRVQWHCLQHPYQWFNFYDFWAKTE